VQGHLYRFKDKGIKNPQFRKMNASKEMENYFRQIETEVAAAYKLSTSARQKGFDPEEKVDIPLAKGIAQRVEGLVSAVSPEIMGSGVAERILKLEKQYGSLDWRVALKIAEEVALEKFCKFETREKALETGIRVGLAYITLGVISAPLEGFIELRIKKRKDNKEYLSAFYAGPIRAAGGTAEAVSLIIADYVRIKAGLYPYDPTDKEIKRTITEIRDYHERVTNLQYVPSEEELNFLLKNIPIEVNGDPTEEMEVSNYKDLERIETNRIRGGICLVIAEGLAQKAPKVYKQIRKWGNEFGLEWNFLSEFLEIQKKAKSKGEVKKETAKVTPNYTYIKDLVAGRPVLSFPMRYGGLRLRYGRTRTTGLAAAAMHPQTMFILNDYIATGTQLKLERPGKAAAIVACDTIDGPIVKLKDGSVKFLDNESRKIKPEEIDRILFLGDILFNYGDFSENGHKLLPPGYCQEWWIKEFEKALVDLFGSLDYEKASTLLEVKTEHVKHLFENPLVTKITARLAFRISKLFRIPLHPLYTFYWTNITKEEFFSLGKWIAKARTREQAKIVLPNAEEKTILEKIGLPHLLVNNEYVVIEGDYAYTINEIFKGTEKPFNSALEGVSLLLGIEVRDKAGIFIGARMGRPEKAKMRKLIGSPHFLFPVGDEGGRLRSVQAALEAGKITGDFPSYTCMKCRKETICSVCETCAEKTHKTYYCDKCGLIPKKCSHDYVFTYRKKEIDINSLFKSALDNAGISIFPDLIKGVKGTSNKDHVPEHILKGVLRAKHGIFVNKDGTTRYDMIELPITHFKPKEIGTSIERLIELGYDRDIHSKALTHPEQVLEIKPQDIILPSSQDTNDEAADDTLFQVANYVDDLLENLYRLPRYYNLKTKKDIIGHLIIGLAPHTSAGTIGRVIGFSKTQGMFTHPLFHAAMRRNCFDYDTKILVSADKKKFDYVSIGEYVEKLNPQNIIDDFGTKEATVDLYTIGYDKNNQKPTICRINNFTKHNPGKFIRLKTASGREIKITEDHKFPVLENEVVQKKAHELKVGDGLLAPIKLDFPGTNIKELNILHKTPRGMKLRKLNDSVVIDPITEIESLELQESYCLNVDGNIVLANNMFTYQCDGDEACAILLMDALLNFSRSFLPDKRGSRTMDAPLVLTSLLIPGEVDDEVHGLDIVWSYPLEFYEAATQYKNPWDVKIQQIDHVLNTPKQYEGMGYTHEVSNINSGILCSAYKTLPTMEEKLKGQMDLAEKISAVTPEEVAQLVIEKHFLKDIKGNLRKFSTQQFRCVSCNQKYRRPPLIGKCLACKGKIIFTISEGSIIKYLEPTLSMAKKYNVTSYLRQNLLFLEKQIESILGREKEKQEGLGKWFG
jgi:DNA polymerase II large subunit